MCIYLPGRVYSLENCLALFYYRGVDCSGTATLAKGSWLTVLSRSQFLKLVSMFRLACSRLESLVIIGMLLILKLANWTLDSWKEFWLVSLISQLFYKLAFVAFAWPVKTPAADFTNLYANALVYILAQRLLTQLRKVLWNRLLYLNMRRYTQYHVSWR